jgi:hypothetical protein
MNDDFHLLFVGVSSMMQGVHMVQSYLIPRYIYVCMYNACMYHMHMQYASIRVPRACGVSSVPSTHSLSWNRSLTGDAAMDQDICLDIFFLKFSYSVSHSADKEYVRGLTGVELVVSGTCMLCWPRSCSEGTYACMHACTYIRGERQDTYIDTLSCMYVSIMHVIGVSS